MHCVAASAVAAAVMTAAPVFAAVIYFGEDLSPGRTVPAGGHAETARNAFLANLSGVGTETFESIPNQAADGLALNFPGASGGITATLSDPSGSSRVQDTPGAGRFATSGTRYLQEVANGFSLTFSTEIAAFGFYGTDIGDFNGQVTVTLSNGFGQSSYTVANTVNGPDGSLLFWGIIAEAGETFNKLTFGNTAVGSDYFGFDDLTIGELQQVAPIPVPATLPLLASAMIGLGLIRRRRRAN